MKRVLRLIRRIVRTLDAWVTGDPLTGLGVKRQPVPVRNLEYDRYIRKNRRQ